MKPQYDTIIVGTGLGGLITAAEIALAGRRVCCIEAHTKTGGALSSFRRGPYEFETSLHALDGLDEFDIKQEVFKKLGIDTNVGFVRLPELFRYEEQGAHFTCSCDYQQAVQDLKKQFPGEAVGIDRYFDVITGIRKEVFSLANIRLADIPRLLMFPKKFPNVYKRIRTKLGDFLDECFTSGALKRILTATVMYYHDDPRTMSLLYFSLGQASYHMGGGWYIRGGSAALAKYLTDYITTHGGTIITGHTVTALQMRGSRVCGVAYRPTAQPDSIPQTLSAKTVVANAALPHVMDMLPQKTAKRLRKKYGAFLPGMSVLTVCIGLKKPTSAIGNCCYSIVLNNSPETEANDLPPHTTGSPGERVMIFVDYGNIDGATVPPGRSQAALCVIDSIENWHGLSIGEYHAKKNAVAQQLIDRVEARTPGFRELVDSVEVSTAKTIERYMMTPGGAVYGYEQIPSQAIFNRPKVKAGIRRLYFASAWVFPGGGFSGVVVSGHSCARAVLKKLKWR